MLAELTVYRCYRSNALWFASLRQDAYSVTVKAGLTFNFEQGEMMGWAKHWLERSREYWRKLPGVHAAPDSCTGMTAEGALFVHGADSLPGISQECICPDCTARKIGLDKDGNL